MYLKKLTRNQKELFLEFAYNLACFDGEYCQSEKDMLESYGNEMQIEVNTSEFSKSNDEVIDALNENCDEKIKKIVIFEAIGLALVDGKYVEKEKELICLAQEKFGIDKKFIDETEAVLKEYISLQNKINALVI